MGRISRLALLPLVTGALLAATPSASSVVAQAQTPGAPGDVAVHNAAVTAGDQARVQSYWTAERMRNAVPLELSVDLTVGKAAGKLGEVARGEPTVVGPTDPVRPLAFPEGGAPWTGGGEIVQTSGRVFFTYQGGTASCSGNAVSSTNGSVVMTAGHCVKLGGSFHANWVFVPGYNNGNRPFGTWTAQQLLTTPQWQSSETAYNYDVGAAVVNTLNGQRLTDVVGSQGIAFNQARNQPMYDFGFPAASPYDGERLIYCSGNTFTDFLLTNDHGMQCDMTGGSSGGPWFLDFDEGSGTGVQNSVNSIKYTFFPQYIFGPYFGTDVQNLYNRARSS